MFLIFSGDGWKYHSQILHLNFSIFLTQSVLDLNSQWQPLLAFSSFVLIAHMLELWLLHLGLYWSKFCALKRKLPNSQTFPSGKLVNLWIEDKLWESFIFSSFESQKIFFIWIFLLFFVENIPQGFVIQQTLKSRRI